MTKTNPEEYSAYITKDKVNRLRIRLPDDSVHAIGYNLLLTIESDGAKGTFIILVYTVMHVRITGRNLSKLAMALEYDREDFIEQFDPLRFVLPAKDAPIIDEIQVDVIARNEDKQ